ncbi:prohibitin family protein [Clostridium butyricum]|uniref:prohibitin family protein n=1 Tax=Clostridium butyricum TaxID=1492 RepID=UPI002ABD831D|nr:prohibitin family protein [Clostridium butyricum]
MKKGKIGALVVIVALVGGIICGVKSAHIIKPGYVGIVYSMNGGVKDEVLSQGVKFVSPLCKVKQYSVATEQAYLSREEKEGSKDNDSFNIPTSDGKTVNVDLEFSYHFDGDRLPDTFTRFKGQDGKTIEETFIRGKIKAWTQEVSSTFSVMDIYGEKRAELNAAVLNHVKDNFKEYGIIIDSINLSRIELDDQTSQAIQARINKQQELETSKLEAEKVKIEAEAKVTHAEGEAKANEILQQSIDDKILQQQFIEKWDGKLPTVTGSSSNMMDISSLTK